MKRIVITGGKGDLGQAIAAVFLHAGWRVECPGRNELDVTDEAAIRSYFDSLEVDLLVCCAGALSDGLLLRVSEGDWNQVYGVNFKGAVSAANAVVPGMVDRKEGHIVFISSNSALHPPPGQVPYAAAKAALIGLTEDLARCHGKANVRVNCILPGFLETKMTAGVTNLRRREVLEEHCLGRLNTPEVVARFILHLHQLMPHTSAQVFRLDNRV